MDVAKFQNVALVGLARVDAPQELSSEALEAKVAPAMERAGFGPGLLYQLTGIRTRRLFAEGVQPSTAASLAAEKALAKAGVDPAQIGVLISTSVSKDFIEPSVASMVHRRLKLTERCLNFDVGNACLGFLNGMQIVGDMIERGLVRYGLVVAGESSREVLEATIARFNRPEFTPAEIRRQLATLTLGSGGAAVVLGRLDESPEQPRLVGAVTRAASEHNDLCRGQREWMETDAAMLLVRGVELGRRTFLAAQEHLGWSTTNLDHVAAHQVSAVHMTRVAETLGLGRERFCKIYGEFGNVGPASIPIALSKLEEEKRLQRGERVALMGIGSGLNCSMMELQW